MHFRGRRILLAEDEALVGLDLAATITAAGGTVVGPFVGIAEALAVLPSGQIDAAVVDLNLRGERSIALMEALDRAGIPFLICSGYGPISVPSLFKTRPFVAKPFFADELLAALHRVLALAKPDLDGLLRRVLSSVGAEMGNIQVLEDGVLRIAAQQGFGRPFLDFFAAVKEDDSACGRALQTGQRVIVEDVRTSPVFAGKPARAVMLKAGSRSVCSTPIRKNQKLYGMLSIHRRVPWRPAADQLGLLDRFSRDAAAAMVAARA
ncbi:MAG: GAF domain-containing protein [Proteobacteria bacterium]|nr:GAF domain-containing protein [Pseudomonadota bacterium]